MVVGSTVVGQNQEILGSYPAGFFFLFLSFNQVQREG